MLSDSICLKFVLSVLKHNILKQNSVVFAKTTYNTGLTTLGTQSEITGFRDMSIMSFCLYNLNPTHTVGEFPPPPQSNVHSSERLHAINLKLDGFTYLCMHRFKTEKLSIFLSILPWQPKRMKATFFVNL